MSTRSVFEESLVKLTGKVTGGKKGQKAKFVFKQKGGAAKVADATVDVKSGIAEHQVTLPKIQDSETSYTLSYSIEVAGKKKAGAEYRIFPKNLEIDAVDKQKKTFGSVEFRVMQKTGKHQFKCDAGGKAPIQLVEPATFKIEAVAPFRFDCWVSEKGHKRQAQFSRAPYKVAFHSHKHPHHKQYVNLAADAAHPDRGSTITLKVGALGDDKHDPAKRKAKKGDAIYVKVEFDAHNSKRSSPKRGAVGFKTEPDGMFTHKLTVANDGEAVEFKVQLGLAGGDKCKISIGTTDKYGEATLQIQSCRKLFYQLTVPKGTHKPDLKRLTAALHDVDIEYEQYHHLDVDTSEGPNQSWFPGEWLNEPGKTFLNIGDYNKAHFHGLFDDKKSPLGVHVMCCHTQFDCNSAQCNKNFLGVVVTPASTITWSDGHKHPGVQIYVGRGLFPRKMLDGTSSLASGTWKEDGGPQTGALDDADLWVDRKHALGYAAIRLPAAAVALVNAGKNVKLDLTIFCAQGPFLGESDGAKGWLQLIVIKQSSAVVNDVLAHELGHTMNQVTKSVPTGMSAANHGRKYAGNKHQGPHCADGMSSDNYAAGAGKAGTGYSGDFTGKPECTCIMYGENGKGSTCKGRYCARCQPFLKAEALDTLQGGGAGGGHAEDREARQQPPPPRNQPAQPAASPAPAAALCAHDIAVVSTGTGPCRAALLQCDHAPSAGQIPDGKSVWAWVGDGAAFADLRLLTYFHGYGNSVRISNTGAPATAAGNKYKLGAAADAFQQPVVLAPQCARGSSEQRNNLANGARLGAFIDDAFAHLECLAKDPSCSPGKYLSPLRTSGDVKRHYLTGHSGGGKPLGQAAVSAFAFAKPTFLVLLDAQYGYFRAGSPGTPDVVRQFVEHWDALGKLGLGQDQSRVLIVSRINNDSGTNPETILIRDELRSVNLGNHKSYTVAEVGVPTPGGVRARGSGPFPASEKLDALNALRREPIVVVWTPVAHDEIPTYFIPVVLEAG